jgi:uncharacterized membrane protein YagU involved in acid resistance
MDALAAIIYYLLKGGTHPENIFKYISSSVFGAKARTGRIEMILAGIAIHFLIALAWTVFFYLLFRSFNWIRDHAIISGIIYGIIVWALMNLLFVPLTRIGQKPFDLNNSIIQALILIFCVGLPISLLTKKFNR